MNGKYEYLNERLFGLWHFQQYSSYIVLVSFIGGSNRN